MSVSSTSRGVSKLRATKPIPGTDLFTQVYDIVNMPGVTALWAGRVLPTANPGDPVEYETTDQVWLYRGEEFATVADVIAAWNADQRAAVVRDRTAEGLRRLIHGLIRPLWHDMTEEQREGWRCKADIFIRLLAGFGVRFELGERPDGRD